MNGARRWIVAAGLGTVCAYGWLGGCSGGETVAQQCVPGTTIACLGSGQCHGVQVCNGDGSGYASCACGQTTTTSSGSGAAGGAGAAAGAGGTAAGGGGATGGGGAGGGIASCEPTPGDDECVACMKQQCCTPYGACFGDADCACYVTCQYTDPGTCLFTCGLSQVPAGAVPLVQCTHQLCSLPCNP
jgi:hypothetical protein